MGCRPGPQPATQPTRDTGLCIGQYPDQSTGQSIGQHTGRTGRVPPGRGLRRAGLLAGLAAVLVLALPDWSALTGDMDVGISEAQAQKRRRRGRARPAARRPAARKPAARKPAGAKPKNQTPASPAPARPQQGAPARSDKVFDFTGLELAGQLRAPQLMYFLDRATEELEQASLERRSFVPEMARSLDEEAL